MTHFSSTGPSAGDLCYRGDNGFIGIVEGNGATKPVGFAILNYTYLTNNQSLAVVLGDQGLFPDTKTYLYIHSNTAHTEGVYCGISRDRIELGTYIRSGAVYTYTPAPFGVIPIIIWPGNIVEFRNVGVNWIVLVNNAVVPQSATIGSVFMDAPHRSAMISMERKFSNDGIGGVYSVGDYESFRIVALVMSDFVQPAFVGSGAKMKATGSYGLGVIGITANIDSFFNVLEMNTADVTADLNNSKFTILIKGHYKIVLRTKNAIPNGTNGGEALAHVLFKNGTSYESGSVLINSYTGSTVKWKDALQSTWIVYLEPGDYVQAGYSATAIFSTDAFKQDSDGKENIFSIALLTRNLL